MIPAPDFDLCLPFVHDLYAGVNEAVGSGSTDAGRTVDDARLVLGRRVLLRDFVKQPQEGERLRRDPEVRPLVVVVLGDRAHRVAGEVPELDFSDDEIVRFLEKRYPLFFSFILSNSLTLRDTFKKNKCRPILVQGLRLDF